jgi:hypothetical protein
MPHYMYCACLVLFPKWLTGIMSVTASAVDIWVSAQRHRISTQQGFREVAFCCLRSVSTLAVAWRLCICFVLSLVCKIWFSLNCQILAAYWWLFHISFIRQLKTNKPKNNNKLTRQKKGFYCKTHDLSLCYRHLHPVSAKYVFKALPIMFMHSIVMNVKNTHNNAGRKC